MTQESRCQKLVLWTAAALATAGFFFAIPPIHHFVGVPSWVAYALLAPCIAVFVYLVRRIERDERALIDRVTAGCSPLTPSEFGATYFTGDGVRIAARCRELFADFYQFDSSRIHPDDKLCADLRFAARDCLDARRFLVALEREFGVKFSKAESTQMQTIRDIVDAILLHKRNDNA